MSFIGRIIYESIQQARHQLSSNKLRSFLSLLGITIGIFCVISVMSAVDSLEDNIRGSFEKLGNDVLYISKMPWAENPDQNYWKYIQRPNPDHDDMMAIKERVPQAKLASLSVFLGRKTIKHRSSSLQGAFMIAATYDYGNIFNINYQNGRWFTPYEYDHGIDKVIMGYEIKENLFGPVEAVGRDVKINGIRYQVVGVIEKSGKALINPIDFDRALILSYPAARKVANVKSSHIFGTSLTVKAIEGADIDELRDQVTGVLRAERRLKPREKNDFAINELSILSRILDRFFGVVNLAGLAIGVFAILVGMFSVANIMFVSVKERTNIIGIKKAIGAKRYFILTEFLIESIILCLIGGIAGLIMVFVVLTVLESTIEFELFLSPKNVVNGVVLSVIIGILSGLIPALRASKMDPVEAIRQ